MRQVTRTSYLPLVMVCKAASAFLASEMKWRLTRARGYRGCMRYETMTLPVRRVLAEAERSSDWAAGGDVQVQAVAYVDVQRMTLGNIEREFTWVRKAIVDGEAARMTKVDAEKYLTPFLPNEARPEVDIVMVRATKVWRALCWTCAERVRELVQRMMRLE